MLSPFPSPVSICLSVCPAGWLAVLMALTLPSPSIGGLTPQEEINLQAPAARAILDSWQARDPESGDRRLHLVYWTPADREPAPRYRERLSAIFEETRLFLAREMERNGFGPRTIRLHREPDGLCRIHLVRGAEPYTAYDNASGGAIRQECVPALRAAGIDPDRETLVIFCNMANWAPDRRRMTQNSPYYAGGTNRHGTAWQVDSPLLDLELLSAREPRLHDGQYGDISPGRYNSIFIGGVIHELGHALGLPHNRQRPDQEALWGTALMGSGNRTYGEQLRGEGRGTFLTFSEAVRLASHPMFSGSVKEMGKRPDARLEAVRLEPAADHGSGRPSLTFSARVTASPPPYAVIAYVDPDGDSDYDATTATAIPDAAGNFTLTCAAPPPGTSAVLRIVTAQANGAMSSFASPGTEPQFPFLTARDGTVDLTAAQARLLLPDLLAAVREKRQEAISSALQALEQSGAPAPVLAAGRALAAAGDWQPGPAPDAVAGPICTLSDSTPAEAKVGWGRPAWNRLPGDDPLLVSGGRLYLKGIYAHAPARHVWSLGGQWSRLTGTAGLPSGRGGSVVMSIAGDGRVLWKSRTLEDGRPASFDLSVKGIRRLELTVSDAGDGNGSDWGLWLDPVLSR